MEEFWKGSIVRCLQKQQHSECLLTTTWLAWELTFDGGFPFSCCGAANMQEQHG